MADLQLEHFKKQEVKFDWIYSVNSCFDSNCVAREELPLNIKDWANIINQGKKLCLLWGYDKPRVFHENGRFSMKFIDIIDSGPTVKSFKGQLPYSDEPFYWTPDLPNIVIKQGHLIKNYLNNHLTNLPHFSTTDKSDLAYRTVNGRKFWLSKDAVHSIIYPGYQLGTLTAAKPTSIIMSERDTWFYNIENSNKSLQVWRMGIDKLWKTLPDYWKNDPNNMLKGVKHCWSKEYYLE
jgi:hypothetical protein